MRDHDHEFFTAEYGYCPYCQYMPEREPMTAAMHRRNAWALLVIFALFALFAVLGILGL